MCTHPSDTNFIIINLLQKIGLDIKLTNILDTMKEMWTSEKNPPLTVHVNLSIKFCTNIHVLVHSP